MSSIIKIPFDRFKLMIFDLDGTLLNFQCDWKEIKILKEEEKFNEAHALEFLGATNSTPIDNVISIAKYFNGMKAIFSMNHRDAVLEALQKNNIIDYFSMIIAREDVDKPKPSPEGIFKILYKTNMRSSNTLYIGNREVDEMAGGAAGVTTLIVQ